MKDRKVCTIDNCDGDYYATGLCHAHYHRSRHGMDMSVVIRRKRNLKPKLQCTFNGCTALRICRELCQNHYRQMGYKGLLPSSKKCSVDDCQKGVFARQLCSAHYRRLIDHGSVMTHIPLRRQYDNLEDNIIRRYPEMSCAQLATILDRGAESINTRRKLLGGILDHSGQSVMTGADVARMLSVTTAAVSLWVKRGELSGRITNGGWRLQIDKNALLAFVASHPKYLSQLSEDDKRIVLRSYEVD